MKKTIDGKRYDTGKAEELAIFCSPHYANDFGYYREVLYRTVKGSLFLHGTGNAMSKYAKQCADGFGAGESIIEMGEEAAVEWLSNTDNEDAIDEYFSDAVEDA